MPLRVYDPKPDCWGLNDRGELSVPQELPVCANSYPAVGAGDPSSPLLQRWLHPETRFLFVLAEAKAVHFVPVEVPGRQLEAHLNYSWMMQPLLHQQCDQDTGWWNRRWHHPPGSHVRLARTGTVHQGKSSYPQQGERVT